MTVPYSQGIIFLCGAIGALAPEVVRLYELRISLRRRRFPKVYWIISLIYATLGGILALILPATNLYAAFYAGVSMPITISAMLRKRRRGGVVGAAEKMIGPDGKIIMPMATKQSPLKSTVHSVVDTLREHADGLF
jgi:hypothetical protein